MPTIEDLQAKIDELQSTIETLTKNQSAQNSYITKLEQERNNYKNELESLKKNSKTQPAIDDTTRNFVLKQMRKDTIAEAKEQILPQVGQDIYNAVEADFTKFLDDYMTPEKTTVAFVIDAFSLVLGKAIANKEHPIQKVLHPASTQQQVSQQQSPANTAQALQQLNDLAKKLPPVISNTDNSAASGPPSLNPDLAPKTTKEAMEMFKKRFRGFGGSSFIP